MGNKKTKTVFIFSVISMVIAGGLFFMAFYFTKKINKEASALGLELAQRVSERENISQFKKIIKDTEEKHSQVDSFIVDSDNIDKFVGALEAEGDKLGLAVDINGVNISISNQQRLVVIFDATGSFESIMKLVWVIENMPYGIDIKNANIQVGELGAWTLNANLEVVIK